MASRMAETVRNTLPSSPIANPAVATNRPIAVNETASPAASSHAPARCADSAPPTTSGSSGSTQGESVDSIPARKPSRTLPTPMAQPSVLAATVWDTTARIAASSVWPVLRAASVLPWKAISVLCICTPMARTTSFWLSKSTTKTLRFL